MRIRNYIRSVRAMWLVLSLVGLMCSAQAWGRGDELVSRATWTLLTPEEVRAQVEAYLASKELDADQQATVDALWAADETPSQGVEALQLVAATLAIVDEDARNVVFMCQGPRRWTTEPQLMVLDDETQPAFVRNNLRLLYGRWLAQQELYDEAGQAMEGLSPEDVVDPASLLFYQGAAHHFLMEKEPGLEVLSRLLERQDEIPRRYGELARLMEADLQPFEADSLDEVARLMNDIERRLRLARAGTRVRGEQEDVLAKLDRIIEDLEAQQNSSSGSGASSAQPSRPAQDSQAGGVQGSGNVDDRQLADQYDWGNLPPKEREEALQRMTQDYPAHYREVIEEYFRRLARDRERG